jgi:hypothetical protein
MSFLAEMLAVVVVWLSSFALGQFGLAVDHCGCPKAHRTEARTVTRSPHADNSRPAPVAVTASRAARRDA